MSYQPVSVAWPETAPPLPYGQPMPAKQPTPRQLYPDWPKYKVEDLAHERVRQAILKLQDFMRTSTELTSINKIAQYCGVGESTLADFMAGRTWPSILTLAQIEVGLGEPIWPIRQRMDARERKRESNRLGKETHI